ncbi:10107_t:CDS:10, partial [Racocetra persica]
DDKKELSNIDIVLKVLKGSENFDLKFLNEFKIHYQCLGKCAVPFYGLTMFPRMQEYAMIMKYTIHDFHCGNILVDDNARIFISDFGLSMFINDLGPSGSADLLSDRSHDGFLAIEIINKHRPKIVEGTPEIYQDIMKQCWDDDPLNRPGLSQLIKDYENMIKDMEEQSSIHYLDSGLRNLSLSDIDFQTKACELNPIQYEELSTNDQEFKRTAELEKSNDSDITLVKRKETVSIQKEDDSIESGNLSKTSRVLSFSRPVSPSNAPSQEGSDDELENNDPSFNKMRDLLNSLIHEATEAVEPPVKGREKKKRAPSTTSRCHKREKAHKRQKSVHEERFEQGMLEFDRSIADFCTLSDAHQEGSDDELENNDPSFNKMRDLLNSLIHEATEAVEHPVKGREKKKRASSTT